MPRWIIGAVTMKMMSSTSMTSTSGTTLISASVLATRRPRPSLPAELSRPWIFGMCLCEIPFRDVQKLHREIVHLCRADLHPVRQVVVRDDRRNRGEESGGGRDERIGDTRGHGTKA